MSSLDRETDPFSSVHSSSSELQERVDRKLQQRIKRKNSVGTHPESFLSPYVVHHRPFKTRRNVEISVAQTKQRRNETNRRLPGIRRDTPLLPARCTLLEQSRGRSPSQLRRERREVRSKPDRGRDDPELKASA